MLNVTGSSQVLLSGTEKSSVKPFRIGKCPVKLGLTEYQWVGLRNTG